MVTDTIFKHKTVNISKLLSYGFQEENGVYTYQTDLSDGLFEMVVKITADKELKTEVVDTSTQEPYTLHLVESACGEFVGRVRSEYEKVLTDIAQKCYKKDVFKSDYAHKIIEYVTEKYGDELEYLWERFPTNAVWRRKDNKKWYGALLVLPKRKLGIDSDEIIDIIDLRITAEEIGSVVDNERYFLGYHMNKKHWFTIGLDGSVPIEEIYKWVDKSYLLAK